MSYVMPRKRDPRRDQAYQIWKENDGKITNREIARRLDVPEKTISGWKSKDKWNGVLQKNERSTPKHKSANQARAPSKNKELKAAAESDEMTDKQRLFCMYYLKYFNAGKAYKKAYGCSMAAAYTNGPRLLKNAHVREEINHIKAEREEELALDQRAVLQKYIDIAFADISDYLTFGKKDTIIGHDQYGPIREDINYIDLINSDSIDGSIVTEVKQGRDGISIKLADKMKALDMLAKYFDLLSESDQEKFKIAKIKAETEKIEAEKEKLSGNDSQEPIEIMISRKQRDNHGND